MSIRDRILPKINKARTIVQNIGLRRYAVTLRRRIWSGSYVGDGSVTNEDIVITPTPRVRNSFTSKGMAPQTLEYILANGTVLLDRLYTIDKITPAFTYQGADGGYNSAHLRMRPSPDVKNVDPVVLLVGDDGYLRECVQMSLEQDRAFGYKMLVHESDRPRVALASIALTPDAPTLAVDDVLQLAAIGTFEDSATSQVTPLCVWTSSDATVATVDSLGQVTAIGSGTATISASLAGSSAADVVTVS
jgi:hypothetical protein